MKIVGTLLKIVAALAALAGVIYVIATYGDKIVAWAKKMLGMCPCICDADCEDCPCEDDCDDCTCDCYCDEGCCCSCDACEEAEEAEEIEEVEAAEISAEETDFEG